MTSIVHMQNFLSEATDAVLTGENLDSVRNRYSIFSTEGEELIGLIKHINQTMVTVEPSPQFQRRLKAELIGKAQPTVAWRIRRLPARVQFAAIAAIVTTFIVILQRVLMVVMGEAHQRRRREQALPEES